MRSFWLGMIVLMSCGDSNPHPATTQDCRLTADGCGVLGIGEPDCAAHTSSKDCLADMTCNWFVPGCNDGLSAPPVPQTGCYPRRECTDSTSCTMGRTCQVVVMQPCWNSDCDACGGTVHVCLPP